LAEGFKKANGDIVISMDGDLQDDPREIPAMIAKLERSGADAVCGWRKDRKDKARTMSLSRMGNFFQKIFFNVPVHDISCTLRVYKAEAVKNIVLKKQGLHRFLPFILKRAGFSLAEKEVHHNSRKYGQSKYSLRKAPQTVKLFFGLLLGRY
jgi:glycosyltransferase involved in cell wall biosynthesis